MPETPAWRTCLPPTVAFVRSLPVVAPRASASFVPSTPLIWKAMTNVAALAASVGVAIAMFTSASVFPFCCRNVARSPDPIGIPAGMAAPPKLVLPNATPLTVDGSIASSSGALPGLRETFGAEPLSVADGWSVAAGSDAAGCDAAGADAAGCDAALAAALGAGLAEPPQAATSKAVAKAPRSTLLSIV